MRKYLFKLILINFKIIYQRCWNVFYVMLFYEITTHTSRVAIWMLIAIQASMSTNPQLSNQLMVKVQDLLT